MKDFFRIFIALGIFYFAGCQSNRLKVDISGIKENVETVRFDHEIFTLPLHDTLNDLKEVRQKYPAFFDLFTYKVIRIGGIQDSLFSGLFAAFLTDTMIMKVKTLVDREFRDFRNIEEPLQKAFKYYRYHFPEKELPVIYFYISGFNQSVVTAENIIGVSLDKYLGRDCAYYRSLSTAPQYKIQNMHKAKIVPDIAYAWAATEFDATNTATNVLGNMILQGKLLYFTDAMCPEMHDTLKIGYTSRQLEWCKANEGEMWTYLVEKKMLYSNQRMDIIRYINDGPYTSGFPLESPGRAGVWIGWQIVRKYMRIHPEVTLPDLMNDTDYQGILNESGYFPD